LLRALLQEDSAVDVSPVWTGDREAAKGPVGHLGKSVCPTMYVIVTCQRVGGSLQAITVHIEDRHPRPRRRRSEGAAQHTA
jgi:hypothetical protein